MWSTLVPFEILIENPFLQIWIQYFYKLAQLCYKKVQLLQIGPTLLQDGVGVTKRSDCYKSVSQMLLNKHYYSFGCQSTIQQYF